MKIPEIVIFVRSGNNPTILFLLNSDIQKDHRIKNRVNSFSWLLIFISSARTGELVQLKDFDIHLYFSFYFHIYMIERKYSIIILCLPVTYIIITRWTVLILKLIMNHFNKKMSPISLQGKYRCRNNFLFSLQQHEIISKYYFQLINFFNHLVCVDELPHFEQITDIKINTSKSGK